MEKMNQAYVEFKSFLIEFPDFRLELPSLELRRNDWVSVQAPSGFGKTTLLRAIAGLDPAKGQLSIDGKRIDGFPVHERNIGFVFQDHLLFSHLNALENVMVGLKLRGVNEDESLLKATELMNKLDLEGRIHAPIQELSGGERQRVALLRALIWVPQILLLDEPFKGLDETTQRQMSDFIRQFVAEHGIPVLCVSHQNEGNQAWATVSLVGQLLGEKHHGTRTFHRR